MSCVGEARGLCLTECGRADADDGRGEVRSVAAEEGGCRRPRALLVRPWNAVGTFAVCKKT